MSERLSGTSTTKPKVLVYGWYHKGNIGDDLFVEAFQHIFPEFDFTFTDVLTSHQVKDADAIFFGGGSFLHDAPISTDFALKLAKQKPIFYIGVGVEAEIHPTHQELMRLARLIATRSKNQIDRLKVLNKNSLYVPDLVFALRDKTIS